METIVEPICKMRLHSYKAKAKFKIIYYMKKCHLYDIYSRRISEKFLIPLNSRSLVRAGVGS